MSEWISLTRDCDAVMIPSGQALVIPQGTQVLIAQSLGDSHTLHTIHGYMVRVDAKDADALGLAAAPAAPEPVDAPATAAEMEEKVWKVMRSCYDPEIPVNIVDLGLVYVCKIEPHAEGGYQAQIKMTLTAPGCGMGDVLKADVVRKILRLPGMKNVAAEVVFDPVWNQTMMSEAARLQLGLM